MTQSFLSRIPVFGQFVDERFLDHRRRSTSIAGILSTLLALCLFEYRFLVDHVFSWDLLAIALVFVVIKMSMFTWLRCNA